jgi:hypothetical protein
MSILPLTRIPPHIVAMIILLGWRSKGWSNAAASMIALPPI